MLSFAIPALLIIVLGSVSFGVSRYAVELSKPGKDETYSKANELYDKGDFASAAFFYQRYFENFDSNSVDVRIDYGYSLYRSGKKELGLAMTKSSLAIDNGNAPAMMNIAIMEYESGNIREAVAWFKQCALSSRYPELANRAREALMQIAGQMQE